MAKASGETGGAESREAEAPSGAGMRVPSDACAPCCLASILLSLALQQLVVDAVQQGQPGCLDDIGRDPQGAPRLRFGIGAIMEPYPDPHLGARALVVVEHAHLVVDDLDALQRGEEAAQCLPDG